MPHCHFSKRSFELFLWQRRNYFGHAMNLALNSSDFTWSYHIPIWRLIEPRSLDIIVLQAERGRRRAPAVFLIYRKGKEEKTSAARWRRWMTDQFGMKWRCVFKFSLTFCYYLISRAITADSLKTWVKIRTHRFLWFVAINWYLASWLIAGCRYLGCCSMTRWIFRVEAFFRVFGALIRPNFELTLFYYLVLCCNTFTTKPPFMEQAL